MFSQERETPKNISEQEFDEINLNLTKILRDGKLKEKSLIRHYLYDTSYDIDLDERKSINIYFVPIDNNILGFQKITSIIKDLDTNKEFMRFNRVVPRHQIKEFPFLNSIVNLPNFNNKDLEPNIEEFISYFTNWEHIGPIAQKIVFANELKNDLNSNQNINKKTIKI